MKICCLILLIAINIVSSDIWYQPPNSVLLKDKPAGTCFEKMYGTGFMKYPEEKKLSGVCYKVSCLENGGIKYTGCIASSCNTDPDLSKQYPDCCPKC